MNVVPAGFELTILGTLSLGCRVTWAQLTKLSGRNAIIRWRIIGSPPASHVYVRNPATRLRFPVPQSQLSPQNKVILAQTGDGKGTACADVVLDPPQHDGGGAGPTRSDCRFSLIGSLFV